MSTPRFDFSLSLGHLLQALAVLAAAAMAWGVHSSTLRYLELQRAEDHQRLEAHEAKIILLERSTDVVKTDVNYIRLSVDEIKHDMKDAHR